VSLGFESKGIFKRFMSYMYSCYFWVTEAKNSYVPIRTMSYLVVAWLMRANIDVVDVSLGKTSCNDGNLELYKIMAYRWSLADYISA
jgi:hypothetical protein